MKDRINARIPMLLAHTVTGAEIRDGRVHLQVTAANANQTHVVTDHVIAATGYRFDIRRLSFLSETIRPSVRTFEFAPVLSRHFESSMPGLYFAGFQVALSGSIRLSAKQARRIAKAIAAPAQSR